MEETTPTIKNNEDEVDKCCYEPISQIFRTLLLERNIKQQNLADGLGVDKSYISRVANGIQIPELEMRLKIAKYLGVDSSLIWRAKDIEYIRKQIWKQNRSKKQELDNGNK